MVGGSLLGERGVRARSLSVDGAVSDFREDEGERGEGGDNRFGADDSEAFGRGSTEGYGRGSVAGEVR